MQRNAKPVAFWGPDAAMFDRRQPVQALVVPAVIEGARDLLLGDVRASHGKCVDTVRVTGPEQSWNAIGFANASAKAAALRAKVTPCVRFLSTGARVTRGVAHLAR